METRKNSPPGSCEEKNVANLCSDTKTGYVRFPYRRSSLVAWLPGHDTGLDAAHSLPLGAKLSLVSQKFPLQSRLWKHLFFVLCS